jgi:tryptophan 2,3-dioxygenase
MPNSITYDADWETGRGAVGCQEPNYGALLRLDELLRVAHVHDESVDRVLFFASHQIYEIWFALVLRHLEVAREALFDGDPITAAESLERLPSVIRVLVSQFDVLATLAPESFEAIRRSVGSASGFQSVQFREIEFVCGLRDVRYLATKELNDEERRRLTARLEEPSVADAYERFAQRWADHADGNGVGSDPVRRVRRALLDFDEAIVLWRSHHASLAERFLGGRTGTGGSTGASYLWRAVQRRLFPQVWPAGG